MKTKLLVIMLSFLAIPAVVCGNSPPIVSNVTATQRADDSKLVDIYYNLSDADGDNCTIWVVISDNGGSTWTVPAMSFTGAVGANIAPGAGKHVIWDAAKDVPGKVSTLKARVYADDGKGLSQMVLVPAGSFPYQRGNMVYVPSFMMDKYEVTNQLYCQFLNNADPNAEHWDPNMEIARTGSPGSHSYAINPGRENYPIRFVSFYDAEAFAAWRSSTDGVTYRLPTEQEWEKAAAWDPVQQIYWYYGYQRNDAECSWSNFGCNVYPYYCGNLGPLPVGSFNGTGGKNDAHSYYGCYDMSGNVYEWTSYIEGTSGVLRSGYWCGYSSRTYDRAAQLLSARAEHTGFRLVLQLE
jgi:formylglycine-generating enzyme required for sulfatase activity